MPRPESPLWFSLLTRFINCSLKGEEKRRGPRPALLLCSSLVKTLLSSCWDFYVFKSDKRETFEWFPLLDFSKSLNLTKNNDYEVRERL